MTHVASPIGLQRRVAVPLSRPGSDKLLPTVYHEPWWLDIASGGRWSAAEFSEGGKVVGRLPYYVDRRVHGSIITLPPLTHFLGPAIDEGTGSHQARWLRRTEITRELIRLLPPALHYWQKFHRGITDVVGFQAERYETSVQFTFEILPAAEEVLWAALRDKHRNVIRKARQQYGVEEMPDSAEFTRFYLDNIEARGKVGWASTQVMERLLAAATLRNAGTMLGLRDDHGRLAAAVFCARDRQASYYSLTTRRVDAGNGAVPLLIWEAIRRAAHSGLIFDFDGLSGENSMRLYAGFGGMTSPRYVASRSLPSGLIRGAKRRLGFKTDTFGS